MSGDDYESEYMTQEASVLHRDKRVSRGTAALLGIWAPFLWVLAVVLGFMNSASSHPLPDVALPFVLGAMALLGALFAVAAVGFAVLRTVVTDSDVIVKYGMSGPTIPLAAIEDVRVVRYEWTRFGGFGIRRGLDGTKAYVSGPGEVVEIHYADGALTSTVQIGADDPHQLAQAIQRARSEAAGRIRVAVDGEAEVAEPDELEADGAAAAERARVK